MTDLTNPIDVIQLKSKLMRSVDAHKGNNGKILCIGGSSGMSGAIILSGISALHCGAGLVHIGMLDLDSAYVSVDQPELMIHPLKQNLKELLNQISPDLIIIGPGLDQTTYSALYLKEVLQTNIPLVVDAGALQILSTQPYLIEILKKRNSSVVITPHPGEAALLLMMEVKELQGNRVGACKNLIKQTNAIVVLKGYQTLVGDSSHIIHQCIQGNAGMASGGMGDVLTGAIGAFIAQGIYYNLSPWSATMLAVQIHSMAADNLVKSKTGPIGLTASEVIQEMRLIINN